MMDLGTIILRVDPHARRDIVAMVADHAATALPKWSITTSTRLAHLLGHCSVETGGFTSIEENLNYSAARLLQVFPSHFTAASAAAAAHNPRAIAIAAYGGRMGNRPGTDDGWTFRGQGLLDCTGRDTVARLAARMGVSPETCAAWLIDPARALECAAALFVMLGCLPYADKGVVHQTIVDTTRRVNGGMNGLAAREAAIVRYARALPPTLTF